MSDNEVKITIYDPSMAEKAAEMFNAFNELWPGGFGGGVPYTESRVHDWLDKTSALADLIAIDSDGVLAGYCGVYPHWRDKKAAYISILGVTPKVKGKKIGKKLLLKALEVAKEKGITRVDLHTWSGNLDAVPLYKKIGLFWVPGTTVYMQDFIPGLLQNPLAKEWFDKHPDWYSNFQRKLIQAPDEEIIDNMEIYQYHFEKDNDILLAEVDRYGWEFCALERILDGKKFALKTRVNSHKIHIGIPNSLTITIYSDYDVNEAFINVQGFEGLHWLEEFPKKVTLKKGEIQTITREFIVDKNTKTFRDNDQYCEKITSTITIDKKDYKLQTSGKIQPAVKLRGITTNRFVTLPVGKDVSLSFDLINNTQEKLTGKLVVTIDGINNFKEIINYELEPEALSGIGVSLNLPSNTNKKKFCLQIVPFIKHNNAELEMPVFDYYLLPKSTTLMEVIEIKEEKRLYLITDKLVARVQMEGGNIRLIHGENGASIPLNHASGPPYGISLDSTTLLDYQVKRDEHEITLILSMNSLQVPGLNVKKIG
ncbi:MAG: GNAT family N-acetyltransferase, partial [Candidatus Thorarchaeota archaeon]